MKIYAASGVYRHVIQILVQIVFAVCPNRSWKRDVWWSVYIAAVEVVRAKRKELSGNGRNIKILVHDYVS